MRVALHSLSDSVFAMHHKLAALKLAASVSRVVFGMIAPKPGGRIHAPTRKGRSRSSRASGGTDLQPIRWQYVQMSAILMTLPTRSITGLELRGGRPRSPTIP